MAGGAEKLIEALQRAVLADEPVEGDFAETCAGSLLAHGERRLNSRGQRSGTGIRCCGSAGHAFRAQLHAIDAEKAIEDRASRPKEANRRGRADCMFIEGIQRSAASALPAVSEPAPGRRPAAVRLAPRPAHRQQPRPAGVK